MCPGVTTQVSSLLVTECRNRPWYAFNITISPLASRLGLIFFNWGTRG